MSKQLIDILRSLARPLEPLPTGVSPVTRRLPGIRAVLWDIYGTLVISGSGDIGAAARADRGTAVVGAWSAMGLAPPADAERIVRLLEETIRQHHAAARGGGIEFPEVDIVEIWSEVLERLSPGASTACTEPIEPQRLAVEYEARVNPVWPMPGMIDCLRDLHSAGIVLGVISNAQRFTPLVFPALTGKTLEELGVEASLCFFSHQLGEAKPGVRLYEEAAAALSSRGIRPAEVLYVGNDMLNDVLPAARVGFRTALFAGDAHSLRLREGDERASGVTPDVVVTELRQIRGAVGL